LREEPFEQQDPARIMLLAQCDRSIELEQRKAIGVGQRRQDAHEAVTVGVRLDHGKQLCAGRALARDGEIGPQRRQVDLRKYRTSHDDAARIEEEPWGRGLV